MRHNIDSLITNMSSNTNKMAIQPSDDDTGDATAIDLHPSSMYLKSGKEVSDGLIEVA